MDVCWNQREGPFLEKITEEFTHFGGHKDPRLHIRDQIMSAEQCVTVFDVNQIMYCGITVMTKSKGILCTISTYSFYSTVKGDPLG